MYICPNDLMKLDRDRMKAYNQETEQCWECYNCVKICPQQAIEVRGYQAASSRRCCFSNRLPKLLQVSPCSGPKRNAWRKATSAAAKR
ncbi:MAG: 4Fe-4S binding protein, partial [Candidatus Magnetoovum sp. WYHC-5]|nr:4Fe-4S binding protein [Candidatus Magnetoovum sp. WYHC-5]